MIDQKYICLRLQNLFALLRLLCSVFRQWLLVHCSCICLKLLKKYLSQIAKCICTVEIVLSSLPPVAVGPLIVGSHPATHWLWLR